MSLFPTVAATGGDISTSKNLLKQMAKSGGAGGSAFIKFTKQGEWLMGVDADDITGTEVAFNVASLKTGYIGWEDGSVRDEIMVPLNEAAALPPKSTLPEIRQGEGNGWQGQLTLNIKFLDNGDEGLAKGSSGGFVRRLSEFMGELYDMKDEDGEAFIEELSCIPVVRLDVGGYKHKKYGWINEPKFVLVRWLDSDGEDYLDVEEVGEDEPEEEAPKPKARKKRAASKKHNKLLN